MPQEPGHSESDSQSGSGRRSSSERRSPRKQLEVGIASEQHKVAHGDHEGQQKLEQAIRETARQGMTEEKEEWGPKFNFKRLVKRIYLEGIQQRANYGRHKDVGQQMLAEGRLQDSTPYEFRRQIREAAQQQVDTERGNLRGLSRLGTSAKDFLKQAAVAQTDLQKQEIAVMRNLRLAQQYEGIDLATITDAAERRRVEEARSFINDPSDPGHDPNHPNRDALLEAYKSVLNGDFQLSESVARRLSSELGEDALRRDIGEKRAEGQAEITGELKTFINDHIIFPVLSEGLRNGTVSEDTLLRARTDLQDVMLTKRFTDWRNSLSEDARSNFDLSLSYGTDIIPVIQQLLPELSTMKEHLLAGENLKTYVDEIVLKTNLGTLKSGAEAEIKETKLEKWSSRAITDERVIAMYQEIANGHESVPLYPGSYNNALDASAARANIIRHLPAGHVIAGLGIGFGLYGAKIGASIGGRVLVPVVGGSLISGAVRGYQEKARFTRDVELHRRESESGVQYDPEAKRRNEQARFRLPSLDIPDAIRPLEEGIRLLQTTREVSADDLERIMGALADTNERFNLMNQYANEGAAKGLYRQTTDLTKDDVLIFRARTERALREYLAGGPSHDQQLRQTREQRQLGIAQGLGVTGVDPVDITGSIIRELGASRRDNIRTGTALDASFVRAFGGSAAEIQAAQSIDSAETRMKHARGMAMLKQGAGTAIGAFAGAEGFHWLASEALNEAHHAWDGVFGHGGNVESGTPKTVPGGILGSNANEVSSNISSIQDLPHPADTTWIQDTNHQNAFDLVASNNHSDVIIGDVHSGAGGSIQYGTSSLTPDEIKSFISDINTESAFRIALTGGGGLRIPGYNLQYPNGTVWIPDRSHVGGGWFNLVAEKDHSKVLINGLHFQEGQLTYEHQGSLISPDQLQNTGPTVNVGEAVGSVTHEPVTGTQGLWNHYSTPTPKEWYANNTPKPDLDELKFHTFNENGTIALVPQNMQTSFQSGLVPPSYYVPNVEHSGNMWYAFSQAGNPNNSIRVEVPLGGEYGNNGGVLYLNPDDFNSSHVYMTSTGKTIQEGVLARMIINKQVVSTLPNGDIATELLGRQAVFNLGEQNGQMGVISQGTQHDGIFQSFASIHGSSALPETVTVPSGGEVIPGLLRVPPIDIDGMTPTTVTSVGPFHTPEIPGIPIPWPRRPLEAGGIDDIPVPLEYLDYLDEIDKPRYDYGEYGEHGEYGEYGEHGEYGEYGDELELSDHESLDRDKLHEDLDRVIREYGEYMDGLEPEAVREDRERRDRLRGDLDRAYLEYGEYMEGLEPDASAEDRERGHRLRVDLDRTLREYGEHTDRMVPDASLEDRERRDRLRGDLDRAFREYGDYMDGREIGEAPEDRERRDRIRGAFDRAFREYGEYTDGLEPAAVNEDREKRDRLRGDLNRALREYGEYMEGVEPGTVRVDQEIRDRLRGELDRTLREYGEYIRVGLETQGAVPEDQERRDRLRSELDQFLSETGRYLEGLEPEQREDGGFSEPVPERMEVSLDRRREIEQHTPRELIEERLRHQQEYINNLRNRYVLDNDDESVQVMLHRLNGRTKDYISELEEVNATLPPMSENTRLSVVIPAYNEAGNIEETLSGWVEQINTQTGGHLNPGEIETIILVNRPNEQRQFDDTAQILERLQGDPRFADLNIRFVTKTFNFQDADTSITKDGKEINVPHGVRMGLIYKYASDLAVIRNMARNDELRKANHLMRAGGADVQRRNPEFASRVFAYFDTTPELEQFTSRTDYPPSVYEHLPLLHVAHRLNQLMNYQMTSGNSHIGLGTFRMGLYAESNGFRPTVQLREEIDLSRRMREHIRRKQNERGGTVRESEKIVNAIDDPRRAIDAILAGKPITRMYDNWNNDSIRQIRIENFLNQTIPPEAQLTAANVQNQVQAILQFYFRQLMGSQNDNDKPREVKLQNASRLGQQYLNRALHKLGIEDFEISYDGEFNADVASGRGTGEIARGFRVNIKNIDHLESLVQAYPQRRRSAWIDGQVEQPTRREGVGATLTEQRLNEALATEDVAARLSETAQLSEVTPLTSSNNLFEQVSNKLNNVANTGNSEHTFEMTPQVLADFIQNTPGLFGDNVQISNPQIQIVDNGVELSGKINARGKEVDLRRMRLIVNDDGQISLENKAGLDLSNLNRAERGYVNWRLRTIGGRLNRGLDTRIPQQWRVQGYQIHDGKLGIRMGQEQLALAA